MCVVPVMGKFIALKNEDKQLQKNANDISPVPSSNTHLKFMIAGKALRVLRTYWLHVPPSYDGSEAVPLVIVLHGATGFSLKNPLSVVIKFPVLILTLSNSKS